MKWDGECVCKIHNNCVFSACLDWVNGFSVFKDDLIQCIFVSLIVYSGCFHRPPFETSLSDKLIAMIASVYQPRISNLLCTTSLMYLLDPFQPFNSTYLQIDVVPIKTDLSSLQPFYLLWRRSCRGNENIMLSYKRDCVNYTKNHRIVHILTACCDSVWVICITVAINLFSKVSFGSMHFMVVLYFRLIGH